MSTRKFGYIALLCALLGFAPGWSGSCFAQPQSSAAAVRGKLGKSSVKSTPETLLGERLFMETRFAQFFSLHSEGDVNRPLAEGDSVVAQVINPAVGVPYPGPFAGKSINCRSCHFVDEFSAYIGGGNRSYTDYLPRAPIPAREDGRTITTRNSRTLVDTFPPHKSGTLLHSDGEFLNITTLIEETLEGRNFGWLPNERQQAIRHIAKVIREDDGLNDLGKQYGGSYARLMLGTDNDLPEQFRIAPSYRIDVKAANDQQILDEIARLVTAYLDSLLFERDSNGVHTGSPYDMFLAKNGLPTAPGPGETDLQYSQRLLQDLENLQNPKYVLAYERWSSFHRHVFRFRELELSGLKIFLRQSASNSEPQRSVDHPISFLFLLTGLPIFGVLLGNAAGRKRPSDWVVAIALSLCLCAVLGVSLSSSAIVNVQASSSDSALHVGNCVSCHAAPEFTDFRFHNTGATQDEYDALHGRGSFARLPVPSYAERNRNPNRYLPATPSHPHATEIFRSVPVGENPLAADLGMWNIFANPDFPAVQNQMRRLLCDTRPCDPSEQLPRTIAMFRTPSLRDLGHADPYLHTGHMATTDDVLRFYVRMSALARNGELRNGAPELKQISLDVKDIEALSAFLRALDEDYNN